MTVSFTGLTIRMSAVELPRIMARRPEQERRLDPVSFAAKEAREARGRKIGTAIGLACATAAVATSLYFALFGR